MYKNGIKEGPSVSMKTLFTFERLLLAYKLMFSMLLLASIGCAIHALFHGNYKDVARTSISVFISAALLWIGFHQASWKSHLFKNKNDPPSLIYLFWKNL
ncbi:hypothetical protein [Pseudomonas lopnurensis]|uniref:hypothetical protein n=1 Tax=Pseudomonas lopnurensis TaxID=1477517 RepID=UPI0028A96ED2|nr:hypothetical protein [Pseudomonas lopnurensis]